MDGPVLSKRWESAKSVNLRLQFWITVDAGLSPDFTRFVCELVGDLLSAESDKPDSLGGTSGVAIGGDIGLIDESGMGGGGRE